MQSDAVNQGKAYGPTWRQVARQARTPRMLGFLLLFLVAAAACGWLGAWQLDRAFERSRLAAAQAEAEELAAGPVPLAEVLAPQQGLAGELVGRLVSVTGTFDAGGQMLVTGKQHDGVDGTWVVLPLLVQQADGEPARLAVVRGWLPLGEAVPKVLEVPAGPVTVAGFLGPAEAAGTLGEDASGLRTTTAVSPAQLVNLWGGPIFSAHLVLVLVEGVSDDTAAAMTGMASVPRPVVGGGGLNLQNLLYAAQWWIFGLFAVLLWLRMVRDAARDVHEAQVAELAAPDQPEVTPEPQ